MRNFDYIKDLGLNDLHRFCSAAEEHQWCNPDFSAVNARKALEYIVRVLYFMKDIEIKERTSLFQPVPVPVRLKAFYSRFYRVCPRK